MSETKIDVLSELTKEEQTPAAKEIRQAHADQMFGNAASHAPTEPVRADFTSEGKPPSGAPPAQGPNISKEEAEFAANAAKNNKAEEVPEEKTPAPVQASAEPLVEAGTVSKKK